MIDLFFMILNGAVIGWLIFYAFKKWLIPATKLKQDAERIAEQHLHDEHRQLLINQRHLEESIIMQEADCERFSEKIDQWRASVNGQKAIREIQAHHLQEEALKKLRRQSDYHALHMLYQKVTPYVARELEKELHDYFAHEQRAHDYLQHVLKDLKK